MGGGVSWGDSVYYGGGSAAGDSVKLYRVNLRHTWYSIIFQGNANTTTDSIIVTKGATIRNHSGDSTGFYWGNQISWKDSVWGGVNTLINNTIGVHYTAFEPVVEFIKIEFLNDFATDSDRKLRYVLQAIKR